MARLLGAAASRSVARRSAGCRPGCPAEQAGLRAGDRIAVGGRQAGRRPGTSWSPSCSAIPGQRRCPCSGGAAAGRRRPASRSRSRPDDAGGVGRVGVGPGHRPQRARARRGGRGLRAHQRPGRRRSWPPSGQVLKRQAEGRALRPRRHRPGAGPRRPSRAGALPHHGVDHLDRARPLQPAAPSRRSTAAGWSSSRIEIVTRRRVNEKVESFVHLVGVRGPRGSPAGGDRLRRPGPDLPPLIAATIPSWP